MKLIAGLGNPETKYAKQRHNIGFIILDKFLENKDCKWKEDRKFSAFVCKQGENVFLKPITYMNNSGDAVSKVMSFYKILPSNLLVIHDDLDLEFGRIKKVFNSESAGHHGIEDIIQKIGTREFHRLRFGIGRPDDKNLVNDYVLSDFSPEEIDEILKLDVVSLLQQDFLD